MRIYSVYVRRHGLDPERDIAMVKEGFSWPALLIPPLWLLYQRLWLALFIVTVTGLLLDVGLDLAGADPVTVFIAGAGFSLFIGFSANDWRRMKLAAHGHRMTGIVAADDHDGALRRYFDLHPYEPRPFHQSSSAAIGGL